MHASSDPKIQFIRSSYCVYCTCISIEVLVASFFCAPFDLVVLGFFCSAKINGNSIFYAFTHCQKWHDGVPIVAFTIYTESVSLRSSQHGDKIMQPFENVYAITQLMHHELICWGCIESSKYSRKVRATITTKWKMVLRSKPSIRRGQNETTKSR